MTPLKKRRKTHFGSISDNELRGLIHKQHTLNGFVRNAFEGIWGIKITPKLLKEQCEAVEEGLAARSELKRRRDRGDWSRRHRNRRGFRER